MCFDCYARASSGRARRRAYGNVAEWPYGNGQSYGGVADGSGGLKAHRRAWVCIESQSLGQEIIAR